MKTYIVKPLITEKTMNLVNRGWYTFHVDAFVDKRKVKKEIESLYAVTVVSIRSALMHGKAQRVGKRGKTMIKADWKKIMVQLKSGQTIEAFQIGSSEGKA